jgi:hypothetical protein
MKNEILNCGWRREEREERWRKLSAIYHRAWRLSPKGKKALDALK